MRGLASPHSFLGAITRTCSTSPSLLAVLFGVLVLLGSTADSCSCQSSEPSWTFLRALVSSSHCSVLCLAVVYQVGISWEVTSCASVFIASLGSCWIHVLRQFTEAFDDFPRFLREGGPRIPRSGALLAQRCEPQRQASCALPVSTVDTCSASAWVLWNVLSTCKWYSAPEVDSVLLYCVCGRARRRQRQWCVLAGFAGDDTPRAGFPSMTAGLESGEVCTVDASVRHLPELDVTFWAPCTSQSLFRRQGVSAEEFFGTRSCELSNVRLDTAHDGLRALRTVTSTRKGVEHEKFVGLRAQKPPFPGKRPGLPLGPGPQGGAVTDGYVAALAPPLTVP